MKSTFPRKLVYLVLALALFAAMLPLKRTIEDIRQDERYRLSDATLGDVDPTSSTIILVLGGFRGVATNYLWVKSIDLQKRHDWYAYEPVVESIIKLQPHYLKIWTFQGWNLAYNISVEWDAVEDKYYWIKEGIKFLERGTRVNKHSPDLVWDVGWKYHHKLGKADEAALLRKLYRLDVNPQIGASGKIEQLAFNPRVRDSKDGQAEGKDNYETAKEWFTRAVEKCDGPPVLKPKNMGEVAFRACPGHAQTNFAKVREEEGEFGEGAQVKWQDALLEWRRFAEHEYTTIHEDKKVRLEYPQEVFQPLFQAAVLHQKASALSNAATQDWEELTVPELLALAGLAWSDRTKDDLEKLSATERGQLRREWAAALWAEILENTPKLFNDFTDRVIRELRVGKDGRDDDRAMEAPARTALQATQVAFEKLRTQDGSRLLEPGSRGEPVRERLQEFVAAIYKLGGESGLATEERYWSDRYADMINYRYWRDLSAAESELELTIRIPKEQSGEAERAMIEIAPVRLVTPEPIYAVLPAHLEWLDSRGYSYRVVSAGTIAAREHFYKGLEEYRAGVRQRALEHFEKGIALWEQVAKKNERFFDDDFTVEDTVKIVKTYLAVRELNDRDPLPPEKIPFYDLVRRLTPRTMTDEQIAAMKKEYEELRQQGIEATEIQQILQDKYGPMATRHAEPKTSGTVPD